MIRAAIICVLAYAPARGGDVYLGIAARGQRIDLGLGRIEAHGGDESAVTIAGAIRSIVLDDLLFCRYFNILESEQEDDARATDRFDTWKRQGADAVVLGELQQEYDLVVIRIKSYDIDSGFMIWSKTVYAPSGDLRDAAHAVADEIVWRFTGERGVARTRLCFVNDSSGHKEVYTVDYDGHTVRRITNNRSIALFPRWSPDGGEICFTSYHNDNPDLFIISPDGVVLKALSVRQGLNTAARWAPDGMSIALTLSVGRSPDIYQIGRDGTMMRQLTAGWGAETAPCFSPDGTRIVYTSDRPGFPQLYTLSIGRGEERRLFSGQYADSPVWSPRGNRIAFSMVTVGSGIDIYTVDADGGNLTQLTAQAGRNENPAWSPDGRFLVFTSTRLGGSALFTMAADGSRQQRVVALRGRCFTPDWSR